MAQVVKSLPAMQEIQVWTLGQEDALEKEMATHSSLAWKIPWAEETGGLQSMGLQRVGHDWATSLHLALIYFSSLLQAPILWPPDAKSWLIGKDPDVVKDWRQEKKGATEDEMAR